MARSGPVFVLAVPLVAMACKTGPADAVSSRPPTREDANGAREPSFRADILPVLQHHCAEQRGCHGEEPTESVELDLRPSAAFDQIVNHPARGRPDALRVKPGDPGSSFLVSKLSGPLRPDEGKLMPLDADTGTPIQPSPLPKQFVEELVEAWIAAGAPNN
jgi:hypothetical protein